VFEGVFDWENFIFPKTKHLQRLLDNSNFLVFAATSDKKLVGGLTAHVLDRYDTEKPSAYIYDLAVITDFQRKGVGKLIISNLNEDSKKYVINEVFVKAESDDIQAMNFYRTTPISNEIKATHFTYLLDNN